MTTADYRFCPRCASPLTERADPEHEGGRVRQACPDDTCGYVHWNNPLPVVAAIVELDGRDKRYKRTKKLTKEKKNGGKKKTKKKK